MLISTPGTAEDSARHENTLAKLCAMTQARTSLRKAEMLMCDEGSNASSIFYITSVILLHFNSNISITSPQYTRRHFINKFINSFVPISSLTHSIENHRSPVQAPNTKQNGFFLLQHRCSRRLSFPRICCPNKAIST